MNRQARARLAEQTLQILETGYYHSPGDRHVDLAELLRASVEGTRIVRPDEWPILLEQACGACSANSKGRVEVSGETTLAALHRLIVRDRVRDVAALNFASAKNPGGGFLSGSQAQEESLARASGLFATLQSAGDYYDANRRCGSPLYTDHAIFSPRVPVFRGDDGQLLEQPYLASFITMPAVNVGAIRRGSPELARVQAVMQHRIRWVLALAAATGQRGLVLGAWGCGVFRNDPEMIASLFAAALNDQREWRRCFERIVFAVFDTSPDGVVRQAFERHLGHANGSSVC